MFKIINVSNYDNLAYFTYITYVSVLFPFVVCQFQFTEYDILLHPVVSSIRWIGVQVNIGSCDENIERKTH